MALGRPIMVTVTLIGLVVAIGVGLHFIDANNANAQISDKDFRWTDPSASGSDPEMMASNHSMLSGIPGHMMGTDLNITSSVHLFSAIRDAIASQVKVSLSQASETAESAVGNHSRSISGSLGDSNGYLTYTIWVLGPENISRILVDAANGQVLSQESMPLKRLHMMGPGMMGPGMIG
jgi:uncharacterized membrane protein YkoI